MRNLLCNGLGLSCTAAAVYGVMDGEIALAVCFAFAAIATAIFAEIKRT